ncbi:hypothetical protein GGX14DRAFT_410840 [Mycena pura]|uniref:C3H1-type domain-containing protein n=1 Tax=Mycena pura TaxID=153505 RepID=A0AAD7E5X5_9AGAR|nr:hypothetical protein GGX14DRAFT_410840 [Mycena pura]
MEGPTSSIQDTVPPPHPKAYVQAQLISFPDEVLNILRNETSYKETIQKLETELSVYKRAYADVDADLKAAKSAQLETETLNMQLKNENMLLKKQDKGNRVVMLIDGDGAIFSPHLIAWGEKGGHAAAQLLSDATLQYLADIYGSRGTQLWVYVFFNRRGLLDTFRREGLSALTGKFEHFIMGFNQATERFLMVDVGNTKEAADAKLKVYLEDEIRLPETFKIIFGGCHDNGYVANLLSQITAGYKEKLVLLKSYAEMAAGIAGLGLPSLTIPELFLLHKLGEDATLSQTDAKSPSMSSSPLSGNISLNFPVQTPSPRALDPNLLLIDAEQPAPCTLFYLKNSCKLGASCPYAHDYILTTAQLEELRVGAKRAPCFDANKGKECIFGDSCCYGHVCFRSSKCSFHKRGICKFTQRAFSVLHSFYEG